MIIKELEAAQRAHHQAFIEEDGRDPEWPLWYAEYLLKASGEWLPTEMTMSQLVYLLLKATYQHEEAAPESSWAEYSAPILMENKRL